MATELSPTITTALDNDNILFLSRVNSLTLQIPGDGPSTSNPSSEPSSSVSSDPPSPNPLLSESITSTSTAASSNTTIKTSASSDDAYDSSVKGMLRELDSGSVDGNHTNGINTPLSSNDSEQNTRSTTSLPTSLNVRFAPLPELAPRKRRSAAPLGMAARKQLMRRRRGHVSNADLDEVNSSGEIQMSPSYAAANAGWTDDEIEEYRRRQEAIAARQAQNSAYVAAVDARIQEAEVENEEYRRSLSSRSKRKANASSSSGSSSKGERLRAMGTSGKSSGENTIVMDGKKNVFGRIVKGASQTLFKKISNKELGTAARQQNLGVVNGGYLEDDGDSSTDDASLRLRRQQSDSGLKLSRTLSSNLRGAGTSTPPPMPLRPILLNGNTYTAVIEPPVNIEPQPEQDVVEDEPEEEEEGRVWEEEIGQTFPLNVGQTDTFVEGRAVYSRTTIVSVESCERSRSATPLSSMISNATTTTSIVATAKATRRASVNILRAQASVKS